MVKIIGVSETLLLKSLARRERRRWDFELANIKAGFNGKTAPKFIDANGNEIPFTWHHLDDFDPITGECTMQLVRSDAHTGVQGMTHSGSVSQYKVYNGSGY